MLRELDVFNGDVRFKKELESFLQFVFEQEYRMLVNFYPNHKLLVDTEKKQQHLESVQTTSQKQVYVDLDKVQDSSYLDDLLGSEQKEAPKDINMHIPQKQYIESQMGDTDLYRFMKHCLPERYTKFQDDLIKFLDKHNF